MTIQKYRKKPVVIEAMQLQNSVGKLVNDELIAFFGENWESVWDGNFYLEDEVSIEIQTLEGVFRALEGDFIIKGVMGEFYPCKPDIFEMTYELEITP